MLGKKLSECLPVFSLPQLYYHLSGSLGLVSGSPSQEEHPQSGGKLEKQEQQRWSIDINFPAPCLTFQRHHHFPTLAVILLNDSNLYLVSLPTPSLSQLILFSFSPPLCGEGTVDRHSYSMAFEVPVGGSLSQGFPFSLSLEFTRDSTLRFST